MRSMKNGSYLVQLYAYTRTSAFTDLAAECLEQSCDIVPFDTGLDRLLEDGLQRFYVPITQLQRYHSLISS